MWVPQWGVWNMQRDSSGWGVEEVTPVRSKVTLIEAHRAATLGVIK